MGNRYIGKLYTLCEWIMRIAYLNLLWFFFTLAGFVILGGSPATTAMFAVTRKWITGQSDIPIFRTYWKTYRNDFWKSQILGIIFLCIGFILYMDFKFLSSPIGLNYSWLKVVFLILGWFYLNGLFYVFALYSHYKLSFVTYFRNAFLMCLFYPIHCLMMILGCIFIVLLVINFPGLSPFFSVSLLCLWISVITHNVFSKVERQKKTKKMDNLVSE